MRNAHNLHMMAAAAALATAIGAATTAMAVDYPIMSSKSGTTPNVGDNFFAERCWTNTTLNISVPPNHSDASQYDYHLTDALRAPSSALNIYYSHKFISKADGTTSRAIIESKTTGTVTNRFLNEGLVFGQNGGISAGNSRYADVTYEGKITIDYPTSSSSTYAPAISANTRNGTTSASSASVLRLAGTLHGNGRLRTQSGIGARVVIEADAEDFTGLLNPNQANGWTTFGCSIFNGDVATWNGTAIGAERASTLAQLKSLSINKAGITLIVPFAEDGSSAGLLTITNAFTHEASSGEPGSISVQLRGGLPQYGSYPALRLAAGCTGSFDESLISFASDILVNDVRVAQTVPAKVSDTIRLAVKTEGDGSRILCVERIPAATVISMR